MMFKCQFSLLKHYLIISWLAEDNDNIRKALNEVSDACPYHRIQGSYPETQP